MRRRPFGVDAVMGLRKPEKKKGLSEAGLDALITIDELVKRGMSQIGFYDIFRAMSRRSKGGDPLADSKYTQTGVLKLLKKLCDEGYLMRYGANLQRALYAIAERGREVLSGGMGSEEGIKRKRRPLAELPRLPPGRAMVFEPYSEKDLKRKNPEKGR